MPYRISYLDEAKQDIKEASSWYKDKRKGLQIQFANEVIKTISSLSNFPTAYAIRHKNIIIAHTKVFPYGIYFYIDDVQMTVIIVAVLHDYRNNELIQSRL